MVLSKKQIINPINVIVVIEKNYNKDWHIGSQDDVQAFFLFLITNMALAINYSEYLFKNRETSSLDNNNNK